MGGHGGLNILPQKSWHVYNRENREKVARDEAKHEVEEKEKRDKHRKAEAQYRHAALLARARDQPLEAAVPSQEPEVVEHNEAAQRLPVDIMAAKKAIQQPDGHFNFWRQEELRTQNDEVKKEEVNERRRRGNPETQTSDARFDERFKLAHGLSGRTNQPWYAGSVSTLPMNADGTASRPLDGGVLLATAQPSSRTDVSGANILSDVHSKAKYKQKHKDGKKHKHKDRKGNVAAKDTHIKLLPTAKQLKASVVAMRQERQNRETAERARERQLLRQTFLA